MSIAAIGAVVLSTTLTAHPLHVGPCSGMTRMLLLEPVPVHVNRARVITREQTVAPPFVMSGPPYTRTPVERDWRMNPGPAHYGVPDAFVRIYVRIGETAVPIDPFDTLPPGQPREFHLAQRRFLIEQGLVQRARVLQFTRPDAEEWNEPRPSAIIEIEEPRPVRLLPLEVRAEN